MQNGNNIIVYQYNGSQWVAIAATKSDEIQVDCDTIEIASSTQADQQWTRRVAGRKSWSLSVGWLVSAVGDIRKVLTVGSRVQLRIGARTWAAGTGLTGYAIIKTAKVTAQRGALANGSFQFVSDGALT